MPASVVSTLGQREQQLDRLAYTWTVDRQAKVAARSPEDIHSMQQAGADQIAALYQKRGIKDPKMIQRAIDGGNTALAKTFGGASYRSSATWRFVRDGAQVLVSGARQIADSSTQYRQFYSKSDGVVVPDTLAVSATQSFRPPNPFAWASPGDAVRYRCPFLGQSLDVFPEHFATLMNLNPLAMYGAQWALTSTTPDAWVLQTQVKEGTLSPFTVQMTLSRTHDGAPSEIKVQGRGYTETFQVRSYRRYQGSWISDRVAYVDDRPNIENATQLFTLQSVEPSEAVRLSPSPSESVIDYRLLGPNFVNPHAFFPRLSEEQQKEIVHYRWTGNFPSLEELKPLLNKQHPGEAAPDPGKSASLPLLGGLMALVGGVWMFKRRGSASA